MKKSPYASVVRSLMYAQSCTRSNISFVVGMLSKDQSNPRMKHWKAVKKVMSFLQGTKDYMLTYRKLDQLEVIGYPNVNLAGCICSRKSTSSMYLCQLVEQFHERVSNNQSLLHRQWKLSS